MGNAKHLMTLASACIRRRRVGDFAPDVRVDLSKTSNGIASCAARADLIASIKREISPLEAMACIGLSGSPGLGENKRSTASKPEGRATGFRDSYFELRLLESKVAQISTDHFRKLGRCFGAQFS